MKIFLDDIRETPDGWKRAYTVEELWGEFNNCIAYGGTIEVVSLDNDLGEGILEGYTFLDTLEEKVFNDPNFSIPKEIRIHSANPVARKRMQTVIDKMYK